MASCQLATVAMDVECAGYLFRATGYTVTFEGYMAVYEETLDSEKEEKEEKVRKSDCQMWKRETHCKVRKFYRLQHFTEPPPRFTEASLIKFLEEKGIGRPSTYTPIITIINSRGYVSREGKSLVPTLWERSLQKL